MSGVLPGKERVVVAMSGGVDSSVAAALLVEQGYEVVGIALKLWDYGDRADSTFGTCCSPDDLYDARQVAWALGIPFYVSNATEAFRREVVDLFTADYLKGRTPNPCVRCNHKVKFERLFELAQGLGARWLATGHYARISTDDAGLRHLHQGADPAKDQSYFLFNLRQDQLQRLLFPLGAMTKEEVRGYAAARDLPTASKHESMEICFVGGRNYADFVEKRVDRADLPPAGDVIDTDGKRVGAHPGVHHFTVGQRRGLHLPGGHPPRYVVGIEGTTVVVGPDEALWQRGIVASGVGWTHAAPGPDETFSARIRHHGVRVPARLIHVEGGRSYFELLEPQRAISAGQALVLYRGDEVLGGGWIEGPWRPQEAPGTTGGVTPERPTQGASAS